MSLWHISDKICFTLMVFEHEQWDEGFNQWFSISYSDLPSIVSTNMWTWPRKISGCYHSTRFLFFLGWGCHRPSNGGFSRDADRSICLDHRGPIPTQILRQTPVNWGCMNCKMQSFSLFLFHSTAKVRSQSTHTCFRLIILAIDQEVGPLRTDTFHLWLGEIPMTKGTLSQIPGLC